MGTKTPRIRSLSGALAAVTVALALALPAGTAAADPKSEPFPATCGGQSFEFVANGGGFSPGFVVGGDALFIVTSFASFSGMLLNAEGDVVEEFTDTERQDKGNSGAKKDLVTCTVTFTEVSDGSDPEFPAGFTFVGTVVVEGYFVQRG